MLTLEALSEVLCGLTRPALKEIAQQCGARLGGTKAELIRALHAITSSMQVGHTSPFRLVSIDPGVKNIGVTQLLIPSPHTKQKMLVEKCFLGNLDVSAVTQYPDFSDAAVNFVHEVFSNHTSHPINGVVVERQMAPGAALGRATTTAVLRANLVEAMIFASISAQFQITAQSVSPSAVLAFWRQDEKPNKRDYNAGKKVRRELMANWQIEGSIDYVPEVKTFLESLKGKRDDVHDSVVQAVTWAMWRDNVRQLVESTPQLEHKE